MALPQNGNFPTPKLLHELLEAGENEAIRDAVAAAHPYTVARRIDLLNDDALWGVLRRCDRHDAAAAFAHLPISRQVKLARVRNVKEIANLLRDMAPDDRVDVLKGLDVQRRGKILVELPESERVLTEQLASYADDTVGAVMIPQFVSISDSLSVREAIERVRSTSRRSESVVAIYVTDDNGTLVGDLNAFELIATDPDKRVRDVMHQGTVTVHVDDPRTLAAQKVRGYDLYELAVVDAERRMLGVVTVDDVIELIEEEVSDTMYQKAGIGDLHKQKDHIFSEKLTRGSIAYPIRVRVLYLLVALVGGMLVGGLIDFWQDTLASVLAVAVFIPVIMDMGGNTGTQSTTIFARGIALGHIDLKRFTPHFLREGAIGLVMGAALGTLGGLIAFLWQGQPNGVPQLGLAVGVSLFVVITVAAMLGFVLPYLMVKAGLDHAPGADPFITTIKDFTGLALYFFLVSTLIDIGSEGDIESVAALIGCAEGLVGVAGG